MKERDLQRGLARLPDILKGCDVMVIQSPNYLTRAWCYSEIVVWLCRLNATNSTKLNRNTILFKSVQTRHVHRWWHERVGHQLNEAVIANLSLRGYEGPVESLLNLYDPIDEFCQAMMDAYQFHVLGKRGGFDFEYLAATVNVMCRTWQLLSQQSSAVESD